MQPSPFGTELFMWVCGYPDFILPEFLMTDFEIDDYLDINDIIDEVAVPTLKGFLF